MKLAVLSLALSGVFLFCQLPIVQADDPGNLILGVPDWNQYAEYFPGNNDYPGWCAPTAGANIMAYWEDVQGRVRLTDAKSFYTDNPNSPGFPGTPNTWQQGLWHDGNIEMGWYMDTSDWQSTIPHQFPPFGPGGTHLPNISSGLINYASTPWTDQATNIVKAPYPGTTVSTQNTWDNMWSNYKAEINAGRPVEVTFQHWVDSTNCTGEKKIIGFSQTIKAYAWDITEPHAVVGVGYVEETNGNNWFVCQDGWGTTAQFVAVPVGTSGATQWVQNDYVQSVCCGYTWKGTDPISPTDWSVISNWNVPGAYPLPNNAGAAVTFGNLNSNATVDLVNAGYTVGQINFLASVGSTIQSTGGSTLTLYNGTYPAAVTVAGTHVISTTVALNSDVNITVTGGIDTLTISRAINDGTKGSKGIVKNGSGLLVLSGTNTYSGPTYINAGTLKAGSNSALGSTAVGTTIANGATLDINGKYLGTEAITVRGAGVGGNGAIINSINTVALGPVTLSGDVTFGGAAMWHINSGLNTNGNPYNLSKVGNKMITIRGIVDAALGSININEGIFCFQFESSSMGDPSKTVTIAAGATLGFTSVSQTMDKVCVLDGGTIWAMNGYSASQNTFAGPISVDSAGGTFDAGSGLVGGSPTPSAVLHLTGPITGPGGVTKNGPGTVFITGTPGYDGNSAINAGILQINTIGSPVLHSVTGAGTLGVGNGTNITSLTVDSINLGTLTIGAGSTVNIAAIPGGPLAEPLPLTPVPEPSALAMLLLAAMGLGIYHRRR